MPRSAPVLLQCGNVVAHCNDPAEVEATLAAMHNDTVMRVATMQDEAASAALQSFESAMSAARHVGFGTTTGTIVHNLRLSGHEQIATRLRNAARSRGHWLIVIRR